MPDTVNFSVYGSNIEVLRLEAHSILKRLCGSQWDYDFYIHITPYLRSPEGIAQWEGDVRAELKPRAQG